MIQHNYESLRKLSKLKGENKRGKGREQLAEEREWTEKSTFTLVGLLL